MKKLPLVAAAVITAATVIALAPHRADADEGKEQQALALARCTNRLAIALTGKTAAANASKDPKAVDDLIYSDAFDERFARFINSELNPAPGMTPLEDAPYYVVKRVLFENRPWSDTFLGGFSLRTIGGRVAVADDASGLGYFRSDEWYKRYEGNEATGIKLVTAYRIMHNVVGLKLTASTASPESDQSTAGRAAPACKGCHFDNWFALDKVAAILPKRGQAFDAYQGGPKEILGGKQIANDKELVEALVESENFSVNACRLAFKFLYARDDNRCDGPVLDRCVDTFKEKKTIQSAVASIANEPGFCE